MISNAASLPHIVCCTETATAAVSARNVQCIPSAEKAALHADSRYRRKANHLCREQGGKRQIKCRCCHKAHCSNPRHTCTAYIYEANYASYANSVLACMYVAYRYRSGHTRQVTPVLRGAQASIHDTATLRLPSNIVQQHDPAAQHSAMSCRFEASTEEMAMPQEMATILPHPHSCKCWCHLRHNSAVAVQCELGHHKQHPHKHSLLLRQQHWPADAFTQYAYVQNMQMMQMMLSSCTLHDKVRATSNSADGSANDLVEFHMRNSNPHKH